MNNKRSFFMFEIWKPQRGYKAIKYKVERDSSSCWMKRNEDLSLKIAYIFRKLFDCID